MSKVVKEWKPNANCERCKQAERIMQSHAAIASESNRKALKKIKALQKEIDSLKNS